MKILFIVNPKAGTAKDQRELNKILLKLLNKNHILEKYLTKSRLDAYKKVFSLKNGEYDLVVSCGGDGTANEVISGIVDANLDIHFSIYPLGTVNDFANFLDYSTDAKSYVRMVEDFNIQKADIGKVNDRYFINVFALGNLANVSHLTDQKAKALFGRLAYLFEGLKEVPNTFSEPFSLDIVADEEELHVKTILVLLGNSCVIGGFTSLLPEAEIDDGLLDLMIFKDMSVFEAFDLLRKIVQGVLVEDSRIIHRQVKEMSVQGEKIPMIIDGELAGELPAKISVLEQRINLLVKKE